MLSIPNSFMAGGICCYPAVDDAATFYCLPGTPVPDLDAQGRPVIMIFSNGSQAQLQMGVRWGLSSSDLARLPAQIARRFPALPPNAIRLVSPMVEVKAVRLFWGDGRGELTPLGDFVSSGMPPYATLIKIAITEAQQGAVLAALQKRPGFLSVQYEIDLPVEVTVRSAIKGSVEAELSELHSRTYVIDPCPEMIDRALAAGRLTQTTEAADEAPEKVKAATMAMARQRAADALRQMARGHMDHPTSLSKAESTLEVSALQTVTVPLELFPAADVSDWFSGPSDISDHLWIQPGTTGSPANIPAAVSVSLAFDASDTPLNFVLLQQGPQTATLKGPSFEPVSLPVTSGEPLEITTHYTDGGPPFNRTIDLLAGDLALAPSDLGLTTVILDAGALAEAGVKAARVHVRYLPDDSGSEDDRTIYLRNHEWTSKWYVVTRSTALAGTLHYETKLTAANGTVTNIPVIETTTPTIILRPDISNS